MLDPPLRAQHERHRALAGLERREVLRGERVQPVRAVRAGDLDDVAVGPVDGAAAGEERPLLPERVAVVAGDTGVG